jgi:hypothetical protein
VPPQASVPTEPTRISDVRPGTDSISFDVSRTGTPVLVKIPYFPNWQVSGAQGPYEVSPNIMAVVPTSHHVSLTYGTTAVDWAGKGASVLGLFGLGALGLMGPAAPAMGPAFSSGTGSPPPTEPPPPGSPPTPGLPAPVPFPPEPGPFPPEPGPFPPEPGPFPPEPGPEPSDGEQEPEAEPAEPAEPFEPPEPAENPEELEVSVVLPAHNEEAILASTVTAMDAALGALGITYEIVIIENGSSDATKAIAAELSSEHERVCYGSLPFADYGSALRAGFLVATGRTVVNFDVDYWDVGFLQAALAAIDSGAAIVLASKRASGSADRRPLARRLLTAGFSGTMRRLLDLPVSDAHGMKALARQATLPLVEASTMAGSVFDVEIVVRAHRAGLRIVEMPTVVEEIRPARTGILRRSVESLVGLIRLRWALGPAKEV